MVRLATVPSHYCRSSPTYADKKFLPNGTTISALHEIPKRHTKAALEKIRAVGITKFTEAFHRKNLSVFIPRKDQCDVCVGHGSGNVEDGEFRAHRRKVKRAKKYNRRNERQSENDNSINVFTMDLQKVLLAPRTNASKMYYKT